MGLLVHVVGAALIAWLIALAAILAFAEVSPTRQSPMSGGALTLSKSRAGRRSGQEPFAPERVMNAVVFPTVIISYAFSALTTGPVGELPSLPDISDSLLSLLTGSNSIYLAIKGARSDRNHS